MASTNSSPVSLTLATTSSAAYKYVFISVVSSASIGLIGWMICCSLLYMISKLLLIILNSIFLMGYLWLLNDKRNFERHWFLLKDLLDSCHHATYYIRVVHDCIMIVDIRCFVLNRAK